MRKKYFPVVDGFAALLVTLLVLVLPPTALAQGGQFLGRETVTQAIRCSWDTRFHGPDVNGTVFDTLEFDDGSGPALYVAGDFTAFEDTRLSYIGRWDGSAWSTIGRGFDAPVHSLAIYDDGSGPALYAGGEFTRSGARSLPGIARWDGRAWQPVGGGVDGTVLELAAYDDEDGHALGARGEFFRAGGVEVSSGLASWNGAMWSALPELSGSVEALAAYDTGDGARLHVGGKFEFPAAAAEDPVDSHGVVVLAGDAWQPLGQGFEESDVIRTMAVVDDGTGAALYAAPIETGGVFAQPKGVWKWNGESWQLLAMPSRVYSNPGDFVAFDDGSGLALYAAGVFSVPDVWPSASLLRWDGGEWSPVGEAHFHIRTVQVWDPGSGPVLLAGGAFEPSGGTPPSTGLVVWDGGTWGTVPGARGEGLGINDRVTAIEFYDDGSGPGVVVSGEFTRVGGRAVSRIARWDGQGWSPLGDGLDNAAIDMVVYQPPTAKDINPPGGEPEATPLLVAVGLFTRAGSVSTSRVAAWDGVEWQALGLGLNRFAFTVVEHDDGSGPALYVGGRFTEADGIEALYVARWDGETWSPVGGGLDGAVYDLVVYDDGSGPALYATGEFGDAFDHADLVRWDGMTWSVVAQSFLPGVLRLQVLDDTALFDSDTSGPSLYGLRETYTIDSSPVARWDGQEWVTLGASFSGTVDELVVYDRGQGPELFAVGYFNDGSRSGGLAYWNGTLWVGHDSLLGSSAAAGAVLDDGSGPALFLGGAFRDAQGTYASRFGKYSCQQP